MIPIEKITIVVIVNGNSTEKSGEMPEKKMRSETSAPHEQNSYLNFIASLYPLLPYFFLGVISALIVYFHPSLSDVVQWFLQRVTEVFTDFFIQKWIESLFR